MRYIIFLLFSILLLIGNLSCEDDSYVIPPEHLRCYYYEYYYTPYFEYCFEQLKEENIEKYEIEIYGNDIYHHYKPKDKNGFLNLEWDGSEFNYDNLQSVCIKVRSIDKNGNKSSWTTNCDCKETIFMEGCVYVP